MDQSRKNKKEKIEKEFSAGGIVYRRSRGGPEIGFMLDPYRKWGFPKGHLEHGESLAKAALRETSEEMGIRGLRLIVPLGKTDLWFRKRYVHGKLIRGHQPFVHKTVHYFLMQAPQGARARPQTSEKIRAVEWVPLAKALPFLTYKNMGAILEKAIRIIRTRV